MTSQSTESNTQQQTWQPPLDGSPCWVEIPAKDIEKLQKFYATIFPSWEWRLESAELEPNKVRHYNFASQKGELFIPLLQHRAEYVPALGLSGGIVKMPEGCAPAEQTIGSGMTVYYMVDSLEMVEKRIHESGGSTCLGKTDESSFGWFMNFRDPEGNRFGCYELRQR